MLRLRWPALLVASALVKARHAVAEVPAEALAEDDECKGPGAKRQCALNAMQLRSDGTEAPAKAASRFLSQAPAEEAVGANSTAGPEKRLRIVNGCPDQPMWIAHIAAGGVGPSAQDVKIPPGGSHDFFTAHNGRGLVATRFWPKMGCDPAGNNCAIGDSGGPGEACVIRGPGIPDDYSHCAPPVDSKFEATFAPPDAPGRDTVDMSLVDGYSLPFTLEADGDCTRHGTPFASMDCKGLTLSRCPKAEHFTSLGKTLSLQAVHPHTGELVGCFSPCMRLVDDKWNSPIGPPTAPGACDYCCAGPMGTPAACKAGPVEHTQYVQLIHEYCPAGYGYAYDDVRATIVCSTSTRYTVTFYCPS
mmetsp:Transcript_55327/g.161485  ORF Transcript_55327/g.161485 Transcript_55327/m.161485 type:complete len:360 (+) Transcript_55327:64-1143(+)